MKGKKKIILIIALVVIIISLLVFNHIKKQRYFEIVMMTNQGMAYKWEQEISNDYIKYVKQYTKSNGDEKMVGAPVEVHFVFEGLKKGESKIIFRYIDTTNDIEDTEKQETYYINVGKFLKSTYEKSTEKGTKK